MLLAYRTAKGGVTANGKVGVLGRSSLSDWDLFFLGAASKLVATGGTYPYVSAIYLFLEDSADEKIVVKSRLVSYLDSAETRS